MKSTIRSIARMCGVSRGTVDRVVNNRSYVSPAVRERILRAIEQTGYIHPQLADTQSGTVHIGFLIPRWENAYFSEKTMLGIRKAQRMLRPGEIDLIIEKMDSRSNEEYIRRIQRLLETGIQGLILNAADNFVIRSQIDQIAEQNIPIVTYNSDLPESKRLCHVGQDLMKSGQVAAGLMARCISPQDKILIITGNLEFSAHRVRVDGFYQHLDTLGFKRAHTDMVECFEQYDMTYDTVLQVLSQDSQVRGVYMGTESVAACIDAIKKSKRRDRIHVIANDLTPVAVRFLKANMLDFVVEQDFSAQAYEAIIAMYDFLFHGRRPKKPIQYVKTSIVSRELL